MDAAEGANVFRDLVFALLSETRYRDCALLVRQFLNYDDETNKAWVLYCCASSVDESSAKFAFIKWLVKDFRTQVDGAFGEHYPTALRCACALLQMETVRLLVDLGADVNKPSLNTYPLYTILRTGDYGAARTLIDLGADVNLLIGGPGDDVLARHGAWCHAYQKRTWIRAREAALLFMCANRFDALECNLCYDMARRIARLVMASHRDAVWQDDCKPWVSRWKKRKGVK